MSLVIKSLGTSASLTERGKKHFSLLIDKDGHKIFVDPAVPLNEQVDMILITEADKDHWKLLDDYLSKYPETPVYSTAAVLSKIATKYKKNLKPVKAPMRIDGLKLLIFSIPLMVGMPAIGLRLSYHGHKISIIPEWIRLGKREKNLIKGSEWIIGVGEYEKPKANDHKATFMDLMKLAEELKPKKIYLTNFRKNTLSKHRSDIERHLEKWNGTILEDGTEIRYNSQKGVNLSKGLYLVEPHARLIHDGKKSIILKSRKFSLTDEYILVDKDYAYGRIRLKKPVLIKSWIGFNLLEKYHRVTKDEFKKWNWSFPLYAYEIASYKPFANPIPVDLPRGIQTFVDDVEKYFIEKSIAEKIKDIENYDAKKLPDDVLRDDWRILVAWVAKKIEWNEW